MADPTITCPKCHSDIPLTESARRPADQGDAAEIRAVDRREGSRDRRARGRAARAACRARKGQGVARRDGGAKARDRTQSCRPGRGREGKAPRRRGSRREGARTDRASGRAETARRKTRRGAEGAGRGDAPAARARRRAPRDGADDREAGPGRTGRRPREGKAGSRRRPEAAACSKRKSRSPRCSGRSTSSSARPNRARSNCRARRQELQLEALLRAKFPRDLIEPVPKGEFGGDVLQRVIGAARPGLRHDPVGIEADAGTGRTAGSPSCATTSARPRPRSR